MIDALDNDNNCRVILLSAQQEISITQTSCHGRHLENIISKDEGNMTNWYSAEKNNLAFDYRSTSQLDNCIA